MKSKTNSFFLCACLTWAGVSLVAAGSPAHGAVAETPFEFLAAGDFDGDGRSDVVIADKVTGRYRIGYQLEPGSLKWMSVRNADMPKTTGFSIGRLLAAGWDALAFTSPDAGTINIVDASDPQNAREPLAYAPATLGPIAVTALDIGGSGNTPLDDLVAATIYNAPEPNRLDLLRNTGSEAEIIDDVELEGELQRAGRVELKPGAGALLVGFLKKDGDKVLRFTSVATGEPVVAAELAGLPAEAEYLVDQFGDGISILVYEPGRAEVTAYAVEERPNQQYQLTPAAQFTLDEPIWRIYAVGRPGSVRLCVVFGDGERAAVYGFDGRSAPKLVQSLERPITEYWSGVVDLGDQMVALLRRPTVKYSSRFQVFTRADKGYRGAPPNDLSTLDENDVKIYNLIVANLSVTTETDMVAYTNTIPGTKVSYRMVPIAGGEFVMGSPESEADRQADEGPQHQVRVSPFWMGQFEVTWDEFELFMYSDEERKFKDTIQTDPVVDKISDAVTRPTRPYVEMSFGMGRYGYPAISMTQHAANKYCQWLSAKTGHFYRLPTESEWEYACRAGTTTAYYFGDDPDQLGAYAWFEDNADFKYQKVGRKKPNPWGLYDMHGNVWEWCLDQYAGDYSMWNQPVTVDPWNRATRPYPHSVRGGSYDDMAVRLRSAGRRGSDRAWKMQDPQLPKSVWWLSDAPWVGFRLVRPLKVPSPEELSKYWTSGVERD